MELAESELSLVAGPLVRPVRSQSAWRIVLGRLSIMLDLVPRFGLAKAGDHGLTLEAVMEFTARTFESPNGEVRSTAVKLTLECCAIAGRAVEKFLPKNLKPAIRDVIDEGLGIKTGMDRANERDDVNAAAADTAVPGTAVPDTAALLPALPPRLASSRLRSPSASLSWARTTRTWLWRSRIWRRCIPRRRISPTRGLCTNARCGSKKRRWAPSIRTRRRR